MYRQKNFDAPVQNVFYIPAQVNPSPTDPGRQVHVKLGTVFLHVARA